MRKTKNNYVPAEYGGYMFPKSCLPDILPGDAGKVLTVNQNETEAIWAGGVFWIIATKIEVPDRLIIRLNKTFLEIYTAMQNRSLCVIETVYENETPGSYRVLHDFVTQASYDTSDGAQVYIERDVFTCPTINDYPEVRYN